MWALIAALVFLFGSSAVFKFAGMADANFERWGYNVSFLYMVALAEVLCAAGLLIRKYRSMALSGIVVLMLGAIYTHARAGEYSSIAGVVVIIGIAYAVAILSRTQS